MQVGTENADGLSFVEDSSSSAHLRINEALLCLISGEERDQLSSLIVLNLHIRDSRYPKIKEISNLHLVSNLRILNLSYNMIERIEGLDMCQWLTELNLAENLIKKIEGLEALGALERLNLSGNLISHIPQDIERNGALVSLRLSRNQIGSVDDLLRLQPLIKLRKLRIDDNPLASPAGGDLEDADLEDFLATQLPYLARINDVDLTEPSVRQRAWLSQEKRPNKTSSSEDSARPEDDKENSSINERMLPSWGRSGREESRLEEGELLFSTPLAARPLAASASALVSPDTSSVMSRSGVLDISPVKGFTVPKPSSGSRQTIINRSDIDNLSMGFSRDTSVRSMDSPPLLEHSLGQNVGFGVGVGGDSVAAAHLQQQLELLSALLSQSEQEKDDLQSALKEAQAREEEAAAEHERREELLVRETETRVRSELEPAMKRITRVSEEMQRVALEKDQELVQLASTAHAMEEQMQAQRQEIVRLTAAAKAVTEQYNGVIEGISTRAEDDLVCAREETEQVVLLLEEARGAVAAAERERMLREEEDQAMLAKQADAASRLHALERSVREKNEEQARCSVEVAALLSRRSSEQSKWEEEARSRSAETDRRAEEAREAEAEYMRRLGGMAAAAEEKQKVLGLVERALERREQEQAQLQTSVGSLQRSLRELEEQKASAAGERDRLSGEVGRRKKECSEAEVLLQSTVEKREEEEKNGEQVQAQLRARLREVDEEVEALTGRYKEQMARLREAQEAGREEEKQREICRAGWAEEQEKWGHELLQARRAVEVARQRAMEEEGKVGKAKGRRRAAELDTAGREKELQMSLGALQSERDELAEEVAMCRRELKGVRREGEGQRREAEEAVRRGEERIRKTQEELSKAKEEEEEALQRIASLRRQAQADVSACQSARELMETLQDKEDCLRASNADALQASQDARQELDRARSERDKWRAKADTEKHSLAGLEDSKAALAKDLTRLRNDIATCEEAQKTEKEREQKARGEVDQQRKELNSLQEDTGRLQRRLLEGERREEALQSRMQEAQRALDRALVERERVVQTTHEEGLRGEKLLSEKRELRESVASLEAQTKRSAQEAAAAALEADRARMQTEALLLQKQTTAAELAAIQGAVETTTAQLAHEKEALRGTEGTAMERRDEVLSVEREIRRAQARLEAEERRVHDKKQELSVLEQQVREAHTLLAQTYDSMHVERARALKELEQLEDVKVEAQHAVHRARLMRPSHALHEPAAQRPPVPTTTASTTSTFVASTLGPLVEKDSAEQQQQGQGGRGDWGGEVFPSRHSAAASSTVPAPLQPMVPAAAKPAPASLFGDVSDLRSSVERLRAQSKAAMQHN